MRELLHEAREKVIRENIWPKSVNKAVTMMKVMYHMQQLNGEVPPVVLDIGEEGESDDEFESTDDVLVEADLQQSDGVACDVCGETSDTCIIA